jgi:hypothetical protein
MSQLTYIPSGWHNHVRPFQYVVEGVANYGVIPNSATTTAAPLIDDVTRNFQRLILDYYGDNTYTYYKPLDQGLNFQWMAKFAPFDTALLILCTKLPNYPSPADNLANSLSFLRSWQQSLGAYTQTEHYEAYSGTRARSVDITINGGRIDTSIDFISRKITKPNTVNPFTGSPVLKQFSDITLSPWTHIDNGSLPLTINSIAYPNENFHINWANALQGGEGRRYNGSRLIDNNHLMKQRITGDYIVTLGKDLNLEGHFDDVALSSVPLVYAVKPASMTITLTGTDHVSRAAAEQAESDDEWKINNTFKAKLAVIS